MTYFEFITNLQTFFQDTYSKPLNRKRAGKMAHEYLDRISKNLNKEELKEIYKKTGYRKDNIDA